MSVLLPPLTLARPPPSLPPSLLPCSLEQRELQLTSVQVGKYDVEWTQHNNGEHLPQTERAAASFDHQFLIRAEWEPAPAELGVQFYVFHPASDSGIDYQHTTDSSQHAFVFPKPPDFFGADKPYVISGFIQGAKRASGFSYNYLLSCSTKPFTLDCDLHPFNEECSICLKAEADVPLEEPEEVLITPAQDPYGHRIERQQAKLTSRANRNKKLDHRDVLFCAHSFHRSCIDAHRKTKGMPAPRGLFDHPCPVCRQGVKY